MAWKALKEAWVPLWVKHNTNAKSGNPDLVKKGAHWLPDDFSSLAVLLDGSQLSTGNGVLTNLPLSVQPTATDFYQLFLLQMRNITAAAPLSAGDIASRLALTKAQVDAWLKRGVVDGTIRRFAKPVRYQSIAVAALQASLFENDFDRRR